MAELKPCVLLSIQPKWCEKIASGEKTVEIRRTRPKIETPFKCYIYCTLKGCKEFFKDTLDGDVAKWKKGKWTDKKGKVIGEFICDCILSHCEMANADIAEQQGCIKREKLFEYADGKELYGWHISDLVIYDEPLPLDRFVVEGDCDCRNCWKCSWFVRGNGYDFEGNCDLAYKKKDLRPLFGPPQSWCYVEEEG